VPRLVAFGIFFWFVVLSPTSSVVPVMDLAVEHRVYLASLGPFLAGVVALDALLFRRLAPRTARTVAAALAIAILVPLGFALHARAQAWSSTAGIWREARAVDPRSSRIVINLATVLGRSGDVAGAEEVFRSAWASVREPHGIVMLALNHGALFVATGRPAEALAVLDRALPYGPADPAFWSNRSTALGMLDRKAEALADARIAAAGEPWNAHFRNMLGVALAANGKVDAALVEFAAAESLDPGNPDYPLMAAMALQLVGRTKEACATYRRVRATTKVLPLPRSATTSAARLGCPIE
jgi:Flp pilus assembly protein TadD